MNREPQRGSLKPRRHNRSLLMQDSSTVYNTSTPIFLEDHNRHISEHLRPLDDVIDNKFIPALFGSDITDRERDILSLPIRDGGIGIRKVSSNTDGSFKLSSMITGPLTTKILQQFDDLPDAEAVRDAKSDTLHKHKAQETGNNNIIKVSQELAMQRTIEQLSKPGA